MRISRNSTLGFVEILAKCRKKKKKKKFGADRDLNWDRQIGNQVYIPRDHRASYKFMWFHYYIYHRVDEIRRKKYLASTRIWTRNSWLTTRYSYPETRGGSYKFTWFHFYIYHRVDEIRRKKYLASTRIWTRDSWLTTRYSYPETRGVVIEYSLEFNIWIISSAIASF